MSCRGELTVKRMAWLLVAVFLSLTEPGLAAHPPNWDRETAMAAVRSVDGAMVRRGLMDLTIAGSTVELLELLVETSSRPDWPVPARESILYDYAQELRKLPAGTVPREAMTFLKDYQAVTLVPHEDHAYAGVPLYNIRAAAYGVENVWLREDALREGLALLAANPRALVDVFLIENHPAARGGYLDTLAQATQDQLQGVSKSAVRRLAHHAELTPLAGRAAMLLGDLGALAEVFIRGSGPALAPLMRDSAARLGSTDSTVLMSGVIENAQIENAALAIATLGPMALGSATGQAMLLSRLEDPALGMSAALTLALHPSPDVLQALETVAASGTALAASRATQALEMHRRTTSRAVQP